jgi:methionyl-tRNA synthetase
MVKDIISFSDFQKLDLRVGKVVKAERVVGSDNLIRMEVDLGKEYGVRKILAGIAKWYKPRQISGKKFIFVANLTPKQMMGELSNGMMLCADNDSEVGIIPVNKKIQEGTVVR